MQCYRMEKYHWPTGSSNIDTHIQVCLNFYEWKMLVEPSFTIDVEASEEKQLLFVSEKYTLIAEECQIYFQ